MEGEQPAIGMSVQRFSRYAHIGEALPHSRSDCFRDEIEQDICTAMTLDGTIRRRHREVETPSDAVIYLAGPFKWVPDCNDDAAAAVVGVCGAAPEGFCCC